MRNRFGVNVGLSDHTLGNLVPTVATALGATVIEKHFILDRKLGGPVSAFSMEPNEFKEMVHLIRNVESALGCANYEVSENDKRRRRSLFCRRRYYVRRCVIRRKYSLYTSWLWVTP